MGDHNSVDHGASFYTDSARVLYEVRGGQDGRDPWVKVAAQPEVPASTSIDRNRAHNIDTDRLLRRREYLRVMLVEKSRSFERRDDFALTTGELAAIENELEARGELVGPRITRHAAQWNNDTDIRRAITTTSSIRPMLICPVGTTLVPHGGPPSDQEF